MPTLLPLSEIPSMRRNLLYAMSATWYSSFILRFLLGLMASPCLPTVGASFGDIWRPPQFPFAIAVWAAVATMSPALGPTISSFAIEILGWRFVMWQLLIISRPIYLILVCCLLGTSGLTILYYQAKCARKGIENPELITEAEEKRKNIAVRSLLRDAFAKPWEMNIKDPALLFSTINLGLDVFTDKTKSVPLVFPVHYGFRPTGASLVFLSAAPATILALAAHCLYLHQRIMPQLAAGTFGELENFLIPGLVSSALTSRPAIHWMAPAIGLALTNFGIYYVAQRIFLYFRAIYPLYATSIFAANSCARSVLAKTTVLGVCLEG
ncbi:uncharacterized protein BDR25DRAFT_349424 [Lindgomyces ingoldianus]|uniref:Uncharacterized protein n=1 Tax=Lindgomyces ingoldianus TaxID=673940 RepID=A0ACB6RCY0_9PLEO|nr:uncharacterized protein BDR25DRAFT_349424 [Lindgomyces ingoldianus]KAF2476331.1 hypothetical protein BDR25DRAFT_349424 [Lindgomyces ingoldianus]